MRTRRPSHPAHAAASFACRPSSSANDAMPGQMAASSCRLCPDDPGDRRGLRQREFQHQVGAGQKRLVDGFEEVGRRDEQHPWQFRSHRVDSRQQCVRRAVHVNGIGPERCGGAPHREALHLVDQHDGVRPAGGHLRDGVRHQRGDVALTLAEQLARERVRVDLDVGRRPTRRDPRAAVCAEPARQGRLARSRRAREDQQPVGRPPSSPGAGPCTGQQRVVEQALLGALLGEDVVPRSVMVIRGQHWTDSRPGGSAAAVTATSAW